jgi:hypothetical protein
MAQNELNLYVSNRGEDGQLMDWTKAAASLTSGIATAAGMRQLRRAENEQFKKSAEQEVEKDLNLTNQTVNNLVVNGAGAGRSKINQLYNDMQNGRISRTQYKAAMANIQSNWKNTAEYIKGVDGKYSEALSRQESGDASEIEMGIIDYFGRLNDLDNKAFAFDDNGAVSVAVFNNEQKPIAYQDIKALNNLMNTKFDKVDLTGMVDVGVKGWEKNKKYSVTDIRLKPELFNAEKQRLTNTILSDNRSVASVLVDHGAHGFYFGEADKARALAQLQQKNPNATEADLVLMEQDKNGYTTAKLTEAQLKKAKDIVGNEIEIRFGREVDFPPGYGSGVAASAKADASAGQRQETAKNGYISTLKAFGWSPSEFIGSNKITYNRGSDGKILNDFSGLNRSYEYKKNSKGYIDVYKIGETESFFTAKSPAELQNFAYGTEDEAEAKDLANEARALFGVTKRGKPAINKGKTKGNTNTTVTGGNTR